MHIFQVLVIVFGKLAVLFVDLKNVFRNSDE